MKPFLLFAMCLTAACTHHEYNPAVVADFMHECTKRSPVDACSCAFTRIQKTYSADEYAKLDTRIRMGGQPPDVIVDLVAGCFQGGAK